MGLPDKGHKLEALAHQLRMLIASREQLDSAMMMMEGMSIIDDDDTEMGNDDPTALTLEGKDLSVISRLNACKNPSRKTPSSTEKLFHPNR